MATIKGSATVSRLVIRRVLGDVKIRHTEGDTITYTIRGPAHWLKTIYADVRGNTLFIESGSSGNASSCPNSTVQTRHIVSSGNVTISNNAGFGSWLRGLLGRRETVQITATVPHSTEIKVDAGGNLVIW